MPIINQFKASGGLIGVWQLTETSGDLTPFFSSEELSNPEFQKYTYEKRQVEWLATRLLLQKLIGSDFTITYSETGKPILDHVHYKHVSISHSRYFVTVFVHEKHPVGIDIEEMNRNYDAVKKRYLSEDELADVSQNPLLQCLYWCAKEAIFKLVPDEGVEFREQIHISRFNPEKDRQFIARFKAKSDEFVLQPEFLTFSEHGMVWVTDEA
jgi:4'-phosphopantetheinyl transferase